MSDDVSVRLGNSSDIEAAVSVSRKSDTARRGGDSVSPKFEERSRSHLGNPESFTLVAESGGAVVGVACGNPGLADDGAGPKVDGLCHIAMVFIAPERWGEGIGWMLVEATLEEARSRGYAKAQLWTDNDNDRAKRLYERHGFERSGREKKDDFDEWISHYEREL